MAIRRILGEAVSCKAEWFPGTGESATPFLLLCDFHSFTRTPLFFIELSQQLEIG